MKCPACENELTTKSVGGIAVDLCSGSCGGIWFDNYEFKKFDEPYESAGEELLSIEIKEELQVESDQKWGCPKCSDVVMARHFFSIKEHVEIDECPSCGGIWLDIGELSVIRNSFKLLENKQEATKEYFKKIFVEIRRESEEEKSQIRKFVNMFKYICPSYYIHGDQDSGTFQ